MREEDQLHSLLKEGESDQMEFKSSIDKMAIGKAICSFLNAKGGRILVGVDDLGQVRGIPNAIEHVERLKIFLLSEIVPEAPITISNEPIDDKQIILLKVYKGSKQPYIFDGNIYYREGKETKRATSNQISELIHGRQKSEIHWERSPAINVEFEDLDQKLIRSTIEESRRNHRGNFESDDLLDFLSYYGLYENGYFSNACVVLFAKTPSKFIPQVRVRLTEYGDSKTSNSLLRDEVLEGNLFDTQNRLERYISNLGVRSVFASNQWKRVDFKFPIKALQEGVINALMHRDYSNQSSSAAISIYPDKIIISNSGHLPGDLKVSELKKSHTSHPVNPDIAHIVFLRGLIDKLGRGTLKVIEECHKEGLKDPVWKDAGDGVTLTFNGPKALPYKRMARDDDFRDDLNDGIDEGLSDGINKLLDAAVNDGLIDGISDGIRRELMKIVSLLRDNEGLNANGIIDVMDKSKPTVERYLSIAKSAAIVEFTGSRRTGGYYLTDTVKQVIK